MNWRTKVESNNFINIFSGFLTNAVFIPRSTPELFTVFMNYLSNVTCLSEPISAILHRLLCWCNTRQCVNFLTSVSKSSTSTKEKKTCRSAWQSTQISGLKTSDPSPLLKKTPVCKRHTCFWKGMWNLEDNNQSVPPSTISYRISN